MVLDESGYTDMLKNDKSAEAPGRLDNLKELVRSMEQFESLAGFLEHTSGMGSLLDTDAACAVGGASASLPAVTARRIASPRVRQHGQTLIVFALGFALFLFSLVCLVADSAYLYVWSGRVQDAAQLGAQSGADAVDPRYLYGESGACSTPAPGAVCPVPIVDISAQDRQGTLYAFQRACIQAADQSAQIPGDANSPKVLKSADDPQVPEGTFCASDGCRAYAEVTRVVHLPIPFPGFPESITVRAGGYAAPVVGTDVATSTCTGIAWVPAPPPR